jgi:hypothetical protein
LTVASRRANLNLGRRPQIGGLSAQREPSKQASRGAARMLKNPLILIAILLRLGWL